MNKREASLALMAKMTLADGRIDDDERRLLESLCHETGGELTVDRVIAWAEAHSTEDLAQRITGYADRFFVALRAYMMATVDGELHAAELKLFKELIGLFGIDRPDQDLIRSQARNMLASEPSEPPARIHELFEQSSFAG